ncbi:mannitol dehydrogenase family protein [Hirschia baltica]|uniref:Mannitol dehydrogenase domain protein n=1 Tax=Hirschia baltica (strain ATCC 49814 / DSM 5838 / IFAM 1418) TaxID=582402 RepID=C6XQI5_HIRBI|nr:mannitol dehydrogenase family protein [Hirschia baltica]ACT60484.1 Mannitol dehydrogenase domain protein [Hirschia baltica ATCC 49814]
MSPSNAARLNPENISKLSSGVRCYDYDRDSLPVRVVHFGAGAFHRAHQLDYFDRLNAIDPNWGVCSASLRSAKVKDALEPQDGLYTLVVLDDVIEYRIIGTLKSVVLAKDPEFIERLTAPETLVVTLTITEKGYCVTADGQLDVENPDIKRDLATPSSPVSAIGWLALCLSIRMERGLNGLNIVSCDNLSGNGEKLRAAVLGYVQHTNPDLVSWIESNCFFPNTMVDSITPATDESLLGRVQDAIGLNDEWPIQREAFTSWIIERNVSEDFPDLAKVGVTFTSDVAAHESAKLRLLNGAHSSLAYIGLLCGHETVYKGMSDPDVMTFIASLMRDEIAPSVNVPEGMDIEAYINSLISRFQNPEIEHLLSQIAWDGSQKLPFRLFQTVQDNIGAGRSISKLCMGICAWMEFVRRQAISGTQLVDPKDKELRALALASDGKNYAEKFIRESGVFPASLRENTIFLENINNSYASLAGFKKNILTRVELND